MKFRQRQILLTFALLSIGIFLLNHRLLSGRPAVSTLSVDPPLPDSNLHPQPEAALRSLPKDSAKPTTTALDKLSSASSSYDVKYVQRASSARCPKLLRPVGVRDVQTFQQVDGGTGTYVFSAFLDREDKIVRVVALNSLRNKSAFCLLWYENGTRDLDVVAARIQLLPESHGRRYSAAYISCPIPDSRDPYAVSVTNVNCSTDVTEPTNVLPVHVARGITRNFTVCVTALNYKYSRANELVEMIELNRLLGADKFAFYVNSIGPNVEKILRWYEARGIVDLIDWKLPVVVDHWPPGKKKPEVHYFAQLASHNDCLNRQRGVSRYAVYEDLDEFIIPKKHSNWQDMLRDVEAKRPAPSKAFLFRCVFFRKDWPSNAENYPGRDVADKFRSVVLSTDKREPNPFRHGQRAKYMVDPEGVQIVGIHNIWSYRGQARPNNVQQSDALLHHYRNWENPKDVERAVRDTDMYRFREALLRRLEARWRELPDVPLDIPIESYGQV